MPKRGGTATRKTHGSPAAIATAMQHATKAGAVRRAVRMLARRHECTGDGGAGAQRDQGPQCRVGRRDSAAVSSSLGLDDGFHTGHVAAQLAAHHFDRVVSNGGIDLHQLAVVDRRVVEIEAIADDVGFDAGHELFG